MSERNKRILQKDLLFDCCCNSPCLYTVIPKLQETASALTLYGCCQRIHNKLSQNRLRSFEIWTTVSSTQTTGMKKRGLFKRALKMILCKKSYTTKIIFTIELRTKLKHFTLMKTNSIYKVNHITDEGAES